MSDISDEQKKPTEMSETQDSAKDELSEQDLDQVSGGILISGKPQPQMNMPTAVESPASLNFRKAG